MERKNGHTYLTAWGETKTITEWTRDRRCVPKDVTTLSSRVRNHGMSDQEALEMPVGQNVPDPVLLTYAGETKTIREWMKDPRCVVKVRSTILTRLAKGWSHEKTLTHPVRAINPSARVAKIEAWGETKTITEWLEDERCKVDATTLRGRFNRPGFSAEQAISVPAGRLSNAISAWGEMKTPMQWSIDPRCRVNVETLRLRIRQGMPPEEAIRTPSLRDDQMTLDQRFEAEVKARTALGKTDKKERFVLISRELLMQAGESVKGDVQFSNKYLLNKQFSLGIWAEAATMLAFAAELATTAQAGDRPQEATLVRKFLSSLSDRRPQGSGDLYLFAGWFCADENGGVWRG